jgi:hypothetical protein
VLGGITLFKHAAIGQQPIEFSDAVDHIEAPGMNAKHTRPGVGDDDQEV